MTQLVLSLFPGIGLLDMAFEEAGFCIVRGPDLLWGGDIRRFHPPAKRFDGVIGGSPCQKFSTAGTIVGSEKVDLIPEFIRVFEAVRPAWAVMENVPQAIGHPAIPRDWFHFKLRDYDCGGHTSRVRAFWTWPFMALVSPRAARDASHSVMASTHKRGGGQYAKDKGFLPGNLPIAEYACLQGVPEIGRRLIEFNSSRAFAIHVLGNGVPLAMGRAVARAVAQSIKKGGRGMTKKKPASSSATRWMKFYPRDWIGDSELRTCSLAARGLWIDMLCLMDSASPRGHLKLGRKKIDPPTLAGLTNTPVAKVEKLLDELRKKGVFSVTTHGTIYCRRMIAERKRSANGARLAAIRWSKDTENEKENRLRNAGRMTPESRIQNKQEPYNSRLVAVRAKRHHQPANDPPDFSNEPVQISEALSRTRILKH